MEKSLGQTAFEAWSDTLPREHYMYEIPWEKLDQPAKASWETTAQTIRYLSLREIIEEIQKNIERQER